MRIAIIVARPPIFGLLQAGTAWASLSSDCGRCDAHRVGRCDTAVTAAQAAHIDHAC
jgi:hypothetical protein